MLLGIPLGRSRSFSSTGLLPSVAALSHGLRLTPRFCNSLSDRQIRLSGPTTPATQRLPAITRDRFSLFRFRSPLLTESRLLSLPVGNEMFHFPTFPPHALCVQAWVTGHDSCRVSPFGHPRITARLAAPRGLSQPPTSFIGSWCQGIHRAPLLTWPQRCSRPLCSSQGTGGDASRRTAYALSRRRSNRDCDPRREWPAIALRRSCPLPQDPTACLGRDRRSQRVPRSRSGQYRAHGRDVRRPNWSVFHSVSTTPACTSGLWLWTPPRRRQVLLRKEVIQPHLPVRLPCYDFAPIASPTFDGSLPYGLGHRLRVLPTFVT